MIMSLSILQMPPISNYQPVGAISPELPLAIHQMSLIPDYHQLGLDPNSSPNWRIRAQYMPLFSLKLS